MTWKRVRLELARDPRHPEGAKDHCYHLELPVDDAGCVDMILLRALPERARVHRDIRGSATLTGYVLPVENGWAFSYRPGHADDEPIFRLDAHRFLPGEYVTVTEQDGETHALKVAEVATISPLRSVA